MPSPDITGVVFQNENGQCLHRRSTHPLLQTAASSCAPQVSCVLVTLTCYLLVYCHDHLRKNNAPLRITQPGSSPARN
jgi:hypothetical protein